jgi:ATP-binding cassette, subfamily C, type I secretion system permease/ATPase
MGPRTMREFVARFRPFFAFAALFSLLINMLMLMPALFMLQVYDRVVSSRSTETLLMLLLLVFVALLFMAYLDVIRSRLLARAGIALEKLLGPRVFTDLIQRQASPAARELPHGLRDVGILRSFLAGPGIVALFDAPWVPIYIAIIFLFHPLLGAMALAGAILLLSLAWLNERLSRGAIDETQLASRRVGRFADQSLGNAEAASALGMVQNLSHGWQSLSTGVLSLQIQTSRIASFFTGTTKFMRQFLQTALLAAGAWLVIEQASTPGIMIAATILLGRALAPIESAIAGWKSLVDARSAYARLDRMLRLDTGGASVTALPPPDGAIAVERLVFGFPGQERPVIKGVSFELTPGDGLAIVGPSAAGKSTLARLLVGLWRPASGAVRLDGADIALWPRAALAPFVGYLPQDVELFPGTVSENIARLGNLDSTAVIEAATRAGAHDMILRLPKGYDSPIGERGALLSAGQRQRVGFARALYGTPRLVVLDEPNSNLDAEGEAALIEALRRLRDDVVTIVVITHRAPIIAAMDKVLVLRDGMIERMGPPGEILPKGPARIASRKAVSAAQSGPGG